MKLCKHPDFAALLVATAQTSSSWRRITTSLRCCASSPTPVQLREQLATDYATQCELLFPGDFPSFADVLGSFEHLRGWL